MRARAEHEAASGGFFGNMRTGTRAIVAARQAVQMRNAIAFFKVEAADRGRATGTAAPVRKPVKTGPMAKQAKAAPKPHGKPAVDGNGVALSLNADADDASFESFSGNGEAP